MIVTIILFVYSFTLSKNGFLFGPYVFECFKLLRRQGSRVRLLYSVNTGLSIPAGIQWHILTLWAVDNTVAKEKWDSRGNLER